MAVDAEQITSSSSSIRLALNYGIQISRHPRRSSQTSPSISGTDIRRRRQVDRCTRSPSIHRQFREYDVAPDNCQFGGNKTKCERHFGSRMNSEGVSELHNNPWLGAVHSHVANFDKHSDTRSHAGLDDEINVYLIWHLFLKRALWLLLNLLPLIFALVAFNVPHLWSPLLPTVWGARFFWEDSWGSYSKTIKLFECRCGKTMHDNERPAMMSTTVSLFMFRYSSVNKKCFETWHGAMALEWANEVPHLVTESSRVITSGTSIHRANKQKRAFVINLCVAHNESCFLALTRPGTRKSVGGGE